MTVTTHEANNTALDAIKDIDQELTQIDISARSLRARRNSLAPISKLPPELLSTIFEYTITPDLSWITVSQTCRHWRTVALGSAKLWSNILLCRPKWAKAMLKRSKMAPIDIEGDLSFPTPRLLDVLRATLEHNHRTRSLHVTAFHPTLASITSALERGAPLLESLSLHNSLRNGFTFDAGLTIPSTMKAPRLRRLELQKCNIKWTSPFLQHLTHFKLHDAARPSMIELLTALQAMPNIETLDLRDSLPSSPTYASLDFPAVRLSRLTGITLKDSLELCARLLNHIAYPHTTSLELGCTYLEGDDVTLFGSLKLLRQVRSIINLELVQEGPFCVSVVVSDSTRLANKSIQLSLDLRWTAEIGVSAANLMLHICKTLKLTHLKTLRYHQTQEPDDSLWNDHLSKLPKLRNVVVSGVPIRSFTEALEPRRLVRLSTLSRHMRTSDATFPALDGVSLQKGNFGGTMNRKAMLSRLHYALGRRAEESMPISELAFEWCIGISEGDITPFRAVVPNVTWDRMETVLSSDDEGSLYDLDDDQY